MDVSHDLGGRSLTTDSLLSEGTAVSRESFLSMSNKLLSIESELDKTLRDLDTTGTTKAHSHSKSKSPSASRRRRESSLRRRSGSIDPLASSRRSSSIDARDPELKVKELQDRFETLEKENQLLETKYMQQRKRLNLVQKFYSI